MYEVFLERSAEKDLRKLSPEQFHRIISEIETLAAEQRPKGCR